MNTENNDFDADAESARRFADWCNVQAKKWGSPLNLAAAAAAERDARAAEAKLAAARAAFIDQLDRVASERDPEDPEASPWPAIAVVAVVLGAAALAWWFA